MNQLISFTLNTDFINEYQESEWMNKIAKLEIEDLDIFLKDMNKELDKAGMQKIVDEANRQYQEWLKGVK